MIDLSYFSQLSGNNISFLLRVMNIFVNETPKDLSELELNFNESNYTKVKEISHKLKGLFKSYNMVDLTSDTIELEKHAKSEMFSDRSSELVQKIISQYKQARLEMIELMEKYNNQLKFRINLNSSFCITLSHLHHI